MTHLPHWLPQTPAEAFWAYTDLMTMALLQGTVDQVERGLAQGDLFYLLVKLLGRKDLAHPWLFERCREVQANPDGYLDLWGRGHGKSSIITFGLTIQNILNDPEITIGIFSHTRPNSKTFLRQIMQEFERNERLKALFPDILYANPRRQAAKWSEDDGILVKRRGNPKEATIEAWGLVDGMPTGRHFHLRLYDDVVTEKSVTTPEMIRKTTNAWELSDNLGAEGGKVRYIGTRYHLFDTYATMLERGVAIPRIHPATRDGSDDPRQAVFMKPEQLEEKRRTQGAYTFACQMLQNPVADRSQGFRQEWLQFFTPASTHNMRVILLVDPAHQRKRDSDYTAMLVIGVGADGNYYVLDILRDRLSLTGRQQTLFDLHRRWRPEVVGYEQYGLQADIEHIEDVQRRENYRFTITALGGSMPKQDRIKRLVPLFESGRIFLPETLIKSDAEGRPVDLVQAFIREEYLAFPVSKHDDLLDCLSRLADEDILRRARQPQPAIKKKFDPIAEVLRQQRRQKNRVIV